jgi:hypothetical protein
MKNAITVIDKELIDLIQEYVDIDVRPNMESTKELLEMSKDLIEINAELTKREQKYKGALSMLMDEIESKEFCHNVTTTDAYDFAAELLKGDSDE